MELTPEELAVAKKNIYDQKWRLNNLYNIVDKTGTMIPFKMNWAQEELHSNLWYCNLVLKARQLGVSTFVLVLFLDACLINSNKSAGIIAHTREDAEALFKRLKYIYEHLPPWFKELRQATVDSAREIVFSNGSSIRVGTSLRGQTLQYLHISEFGKICSKYPDKAEEIITGSLNTIAPGQWVIIESTAEGKEGYFYEMAKRAENLKQEGKKLTPIDYKFHFFPWWKEPLYKQGNSLHITNDLQEYFIGLKSLGIELDDQQKNWYATQILTQGGKMKREYPSTTDECWEQSNEGAYYNKQITLARLENRIGKIPWDERLPVITGWDLGYNDSTAIWYIQVFRHEIRVIDYDEGSGESLAHWCKIVKNKPYAYDRHFAPHDISVHEYSSGVSRKTTARQLGIPFIAVKRHDPIEGIDMARGLFNKCYFDENKCEKGIKALENYRKEWDDKRETWLSHPLHNWASHGADGFRTLAVGMARHINRFDPVKEREQLNTHKDEAGLLPGHWLNSNTYGADRGDHYNTVWRNFT